MTESYLQAAQGLVSLLDFFRFGLSCANKKSLYYGHGTDNSWDDILSLITGTLSLSTDFDPIFFNAKLTQDEIVKLCSQLKKRIDDQIPVPYLIQEAWFCGYKFYVDERVLIPRSPIAELINQQFSPWIMEENVLNILDMCTGSGCIAIACGHAFPNATITAVDISADALDVAKINQDNHNMHDNLTLVKSDCFNDLELQQYDIIVSNPPYVSHTEMQSLPTEYLHEPNIALETTNNGLSIIEKILDHAHHYLTEHGILIIEVGNSEEALIEAYPHIPFTWLDFENGGQGVLLLTKQQLMNAHGITNAASCTYDPADIHTQHYQNTISEMALHQRDDNNKVTKLKD